MQNNDVNTTPLYAGFFVRLCAYVVDILLVGLITMVVRLPLSFLAMAHPNNFLVRDLIFKYSLADIILYLLSLLYFVALTYNTGSTLGKKLFRLEVIASDKEFLDLFDVIYRESIGRYLSAVFLNVGYLVAGLDKEKRGFHDMLADTRVIYADGKHKNHVQKKWDDYYAVPMDVMGRPIPQDKESGTYQFSTPKDVEMPQSGDYVSHTNYNNRDEM